MSQEKGKKRVKNEPVHWSELKKTRTLTLTDTAWDELKLAGDQMEGISRSEVVERLARGVDRAALQKREARKRYNAKNVDKVRESKRIAAAKKYEATMPDTYQAYLAVYDAEFKMKAHGAKTRAAKILGIDARAIGRAIEWRERSKN